MGNTPTTSITGQTAVESNQHGCAKYIGLGGAAARYENLTAQGCVSLPVSSIDGAYQVPGTFRLEPELNLRSMWLGHSGPRGMCRQLRRDRERGRATSAGNGALSRTTPRLLATTWADRFAASGPPGPQGTRVWHRRRTPALAPRVCGAGRRRLPRSSPFRSSAGLTMTTVLRKSVTGWAGS